MNNLLTVEEVWGILKLVLWGALLVAVLIGIDTAIKNATDVTAPGNNNLNIGPAIDTD